MDLKANRVDLVKREDGDWVGDIPECGGLRIRTKGTGNKAYLKLQDKLIQAVPRKQRVNGLSPEDRQRIRNICLCNTCLLEWDGLTDGGVVVPYSKEKASELMTNPEWEVFQDAVAYAAGAVATQTETELEDDAKN